MKWFEGPVVDAISIAKQKNSFFVVYVEGNDKMSETMTSVINSPEISNHLESEKFVSVRIHPDSDLFKHFINIYKQVPIPSLFLINILNGAPIAIVHNALDEDKEKLRNNLLQILGEETKEEFYGRGVLAQKTSSFCLNFQEKENTDVSDEDNESKTVYSAAFDEENANENIASTSATVSEPRDTGLRNAETWELKVLAAEIKTEGIGGETLPRGSRPTCKRKIQNEDLEQTENVGKSSGIEINSAEKRTKIDEERLEKMKNELDRQRILKDIELDRQERMSHQQFTTTSNRSESSTVQSRAHSRHQTCIQFRKPDGAAVKHVFNVNSVIDDLRVYVRENISLDFIQFDLAVGFPRHVFTAEENTKTLEELELTPNAVILILPIAKSLVSNVYHSMLWFLPRLW